MFTGIVQKVAEVQTVRHAGAASVLWLELDDLAREVKVGDSVMVEGVCLTATDIEAGGVAFDVSSETLDRTTLGLLQRGAGVNVELAMRPQDRFGGHFVSGHIDGTGRMIAKTKRPGETRLRVKVEPELTEQMIMKGSVAVDGISLTVAELARGRFEVSLIPHTLAMTNLRDKAAGDPVNIECDMIGKWVRKFARQSEGDEDLLTMDKLRENGF
jgi:riboflavin synthase